MIAVIVTIQVLLLNIGFQDWRRLSSHLFQPIADNSFLRPNIFCLLFCFLCYLSIYLHDWIPQKMSLSHKSDHDRRLSLLAKKSTQTDCKKCGPTYISIRSKKTWLKKFYSFSSITFLWLHYSYSSSSLVRN